MKTETKIGIALLLLSFFFAFVAWDSWHNALATLETMRKASPDIEVPVRPGAFAASKYSLLLAFRSRPRSRSGQQE